MFKQVPEYQKQIIKFTIIGVIAVLVDLSIYYLLLNILPVNNEGLITIEAVSKTFSFISGTFVTYNLNKFWTWRQRNNSKTRFAKFLFLYSSSMLLNVATNSIVLMVCQEYESVYHVPHEYVVAFICATGASAVYNFLGQKFWVFSLRAVK